MSAAIQGQQSLGWVSSHQTAAPAFSPTIGAHVVETISGRRIDLQRPALAAIDMGDIAYGLSRIARFLGQTRYGQIYSVAEHSLWVSVYLFRTTQSAEIALYGLLHDAHEAYTGDIAHPVKTLPIVHDEIVRLQSRLQLAIYQAIDLPSPSDEVLQQVHDADRIALAVEADALMHSGGKDWGLPPIPDAAKKIPMRTLGMEPTLAGRAFAGRFYLLYKKVCGARS